MSQNSAKQRYTQLVAWLPTLASYKAKNSNEKPGKKFSKSDHYKKVNKHYGHKNSN